MSVSFILLLAAGFLVGCGVYLITERTLSRVVIGLSLLGNGVNLFLLSQGGPAGDSPILTGKESTVSDPLPQAMILTAIVLTMATTAFGLALAYRAWRLNGHDEVIDDVEDYRLAKSANTREWAQRLDLEIPEKYLRKPERLSERKQSAPAGNPGKTAASTGLVLASSDSKLAKQPPNPPDLTHPASAASPGPGPSLDQMPASGQGPSLSTPSAPSPSLTEKSPGTAGLTSLPSTLKKGGKQ